MQTTISGVILAGGKAERMGGQDKGLCRVNARYLIEYALEALRPQVSQILINANRHLDQYAQIGNCPVIADADSGKFLGPVAGIISGLQAAQTEYVVFVPCDAPLIHPQLVARLSQALHSAQAEISVVHDGAQLQPVFVLLMRQLLPELQNALHVGERSVYRLYQKHHVVTVDFSDCPEMFMNLNTPQQLQAFAQYVL